MSRGALLAALLLAAAACDVGDRGRPEGDGGAAAARTRVERPSFSGTRAFEHIERQVAFGPRIPGTEGHRAQAAWMREHLAARADTLLVDEFTYTTTGGERLELTNFVARFAPDAPRRIVILAHWDTRPEADQARDPADRTKPVPGANDGASGTAVLLELAELLATQPPPLGVDLLFVDGEDFGPTTADMFIGSKRYAATIEAADRPAYGVLLDMVADQDPEFPIEGFSADRAPQIAQRVWGVARELGFGRWFPVRVGSAVTDDHIPLNDAGIPTANVIDFRYGPGNQLWHTPYDLPENTSAETLHMVGEVVTELIYRGG